MCFAPNKDGLKIPSKISGLACERFDARRSCTTCEHRCPPDVRETSGSEPDGCPRWELRRLSTWGGYRGGVRRKVNKSSATKKKEM